MKTAWKVFGGAGLILVVILAGAIGRLIGKTSADGYSEGRKEGALDAVLLKSASDLNSKLPMMVDAETRLDTTIGLNRTFRYNYTMVNHTSSTLSATQLEKALGQKLINSVCTTKEMQIFVNNGVAVSYAYFGSDGKQITVITVLPSQCGAR